MTMKKSIREPLWRRALHFIGTHRHCYTSTTPDQRIVNCRGATVGRYRYTFDNEPYTHGGVK